MAKKNGNGGKNGGNDAPKDEPKKKPDATPPAGDAAAKDAPPQSAGQPNVAGDTAPKDAPQQGAGANPPPAPAGNTPPAADAKVKLGTPKLVGEKYEFVGTTHSELPAAEAALKDAEAKLIAKVQGSENHLGKLVDSVTDATEKAKVQGLVDQVKSSNSLAALAKPAEADKVAAAKIEAHLKSNAGAEHTAVVGARKKVELGKYEILEKEAEFLKGKKHTDLGTSEEAHKKALESHKTEFKGVKKSLQKGRFGILFGGGEGSGIIAAIKHNLGKEAWHHHKGIMIANSAVTLGGLIAMGDAIFRSEYKGADEKPEKRSALGRFTELVLGAGGVVGGALRGGR